MFSVILFSYVVLACGGVLESTRARLDKIGKMVFHVFTVFPSALVPGSVPYIRL